MAVVGGREASGVLTTVLPLRSRTATSVRHDHREEEPAGSRGDGQPQAASGCERVYGSTVPAASLTVCGTTVHVPPPVVPHRTRPGSRFGDGHTVDAVRRGLDVHVRLDPTVEMGDTTREGAKGRAAADREGATRGEGDDAPARRERCRGDDREMAEAARRPRRQVRTARRGRHRQGQRRGAVAVRGDPARDPGRGGRDGPQQRRDRRDRDGRRGCHRDRAGARRNGARRRFEARRTGGRGADRRRLDAGERGGLHDAGREPAAGRRGRTGRQ